MDRNPVLVLGSTGFIGRNLVPELLREGFPVRVMVRDTSRMSSMPWGNDVEVFQGDAEKAKSLSDAMQGIKTAYYLIHSMSGRSIFGNRVVSEKDRFIARAFVDAAECAGLRRVIHLSSIGEKGEKIARHLRGRAKVPGILLPGPAEATVLRSSLIIGAGGASYEMLRRLAERLPLMAWPRWIDSPVQPIALQDVLRYLVGCLKIPETSGQIFDIGGPDVLTYRQMIKEYAVALGLHRRVIFSLPLHASLPSAYIVSLMTSVPPGLAYQRILRLKQKLVCENHDIEKLIPLKQTTFLEAVRIAHAQEMKELDRMSGFSGGSDSISVSGNK